MSQFPDCHSLLYLSLLHGFPSYSLPYEEKMRWNYGKHSQSHYPDRDAGVPAGIFTPEPRAEIFRFLLAVERLSGTEDLLPVLAAEDVLEQAELFEGERFTIEGQIRSFNNREPTGRRLILCVYALSMTTTDAPMQNEAVLTGTVCKPPVYRQTPLGRQITDLCLAVPRLYRRTDYIPCILWGRTALAAAEYPTGTELTLTGRLQSRTYLKNLGETSETRTAYEFSVSACERVPEFAIF